MSPNDLTPKTQPCAKCGAVVYVAVEARHDSTSGVIRITMPKPDPLAPVLCDNCKADVKMN